MSIYDTLINKDQQYYDTVNIYGNKNQLHLFDKWLKQLNINVDDTSLDTGERIRSRSIVLTNQHSTHQLPPPFPVSEKIIDFTLFMFGSESEISDTIHITSEELREIEDIVKKNKLKYDIN